MYMYMYYVYMHLIYVYPRSVYLQYADDRVVTAGARQQLLRALTVKNGFKASAFLPLRWRAEYGRG